jgi:CDP-paratose 2-epimerase
MTHRGRAGRRVYNVGGGPANAMSLAQLSAWCAGQFGTQKVRSEKSQRPYDVAWLVMDNAQAAKDFRWKPRRSLKSILQEIAAHARRYPNWLKLTGAL